MVNRKQESTTVNDVSLAATKRCTKCGDTKPLEGFCRDRAKKDGRNGWCRACAAIYRQSPAGVRAHRKYHQSEHGSKVLRDYFESDHGRATSARYRQSDRGRQIMRYHNQSEEGKASNRRWCQSDRGRAFLASQKQRNPEKVKARDVVAKAIKRGDIISQPCEVCRATKHVHGHHDDYSKPLEVRWLCAQHHADHHRAMKATDRISSQSKRHQTREV